MQKSLNGIIFLLLIINNKVCLCLIVGWNFTIHNKNMFLFFFKCNETKTYFRCVYAIMKTCLIGHNEKKTWEIRIWLTTRRVQCVAAWDVLCKGDGHAYRRWRITIEEKKEGEWCVKVCCGSKVREINREGKSARKGRGQNWKFISKK